MLGPSVPTLEFRGRIAPRYLPTCKIAATDSPAKKRCHVKRDCTDVNDVIDSHSRGRLTFLSIEYNVNEFLPFSGV